MAKKLKKTTIASITATAPDSVEPRSMVKRAANSWRAASLPARILLVTALVIGVTASITGLASSYPIVEPYFYVMRWELRQLTNTLTIATDRQTLYQLNADLDRVEKDMVTSPSDTVHRRMEEIKKHIAETKARICKATGKEC